MGFFDALFSPRNSIDDFDSGGDWITQTSDSGVTVTTESAMRLVSVYACVTLIADAVRSLPIDVYQKNQAGRGLVEPPVWLSQPNRNQTWGQFIDYGLHSLLTNGNMFVWLPSNNGLGFPDVLEIVHPDDVEVDRVDGVKKFVVNGKDLKEYTAQQPNGKMLHVLGHTADGLVGLSPIEQARQAIGSGLAIEQFGNKFFANGAVPSAAVELPPGSVGTEDQMRSLSRQFDRKHTGLKNAFKPIVLANGATYKPMSIPNDQAQFIESARMSVAEIARLYRVPPHLIGDVERSTSWGTGIEQQGIGFVQYTLMPWITRLEESLSLLLPADQFVKFNVAGLLRGDTKSRYEAYQIGIQNGYLLRNEVRELEDRPPLEGGDQALMPLNLTATDSKTAMASTRELTEMIQKIYLGVGKVLSAEEAREILNREGAGLDDDFVPTLIPTTPPE